jgi:hypothetical protein
VWEDDTLTVTGLLQNFDGVNNVSDGANPDHSQPTTVVLEKGEDSDYDLACSRLAPAAG